MNLVEIGKKYPSSKNISGFIQLYDKYFTPYKDLEINILEIGVDNGDSLRIWREYFSKANICGIDIHKKNFEIKDTNILQGDQSDRNFLNKLVTEYKYFVLLYTGYHLVQLWYIDLQLNYLQLKMFDPSSISMYMNQHLH